MTNFELLVIVGSVLFLICVLLFNTFSLTSKYVREKVDNNNKELVMQFESLVIDGAPMEFNKILAELFDGDSLAAFIALRYFVKKNYKGDLYMYNLALS